VGEIRGFDEEEIKAGVHPAASGMHHAYRLLFQRNAFGTAAGNPGTPPDTLVRFRRYTRRYVTLRGVCDSMPPTHRIKKSPFFCTFPFLDYICALYPESMRLHDPLSPPQSDVCMRVSLGQTPKNRKPVFYVPTNIYTFPA
jgi:hypothetical protein